MDTSFVSFTLAGDDQVYKLEFDFNNVCDAESDAGCNLMAALAGGNINASQTRGLLVAFLKKWHPAVLLQEAGSLLTKDLDTVLGALGEAIKLARGSEEEIPAVVPVPESADQTAE